MKTKVELQLMADGEILQYIHPGTYQSIIGKDSHPLFRAYCIGEEGDATPKIVGGGSRVLNWLRSAISTMVQKLQFGTKIFLHHGTTNAHEGRTVVGELVGKALEYVDGKMRAIAVTYIYPQHRDVPADAASIEAEIEIDPTGTSNTISDVHLQKITGIAVGDKSKVKTAFPAAGLVAQLQAFEEQHITKEGGGIMDLTLEQVRDFIMLRRLTPSELFGDDQITKDPVVRGKIKAEYDQRERVEKDLKALKDEMTEKNTKLETENKDLRKVLVSGKAQTMVQDIMTERKMPDPKANFVKMQVPKFKVEGEDLDDNVIKTQLNKFIDTQLDEFTKLEQVFSPTNGNGVVKGSEEPDTTGGDSDLIKEV